MLYDLLNSGYGNDKNYNCSEKILYGSNEVYNLGLDNNSLKVSYCFGGGMAIESICGAITGSLMVLGILLKNNVHKEEMKKIVRNFMAEYEKEMGDVSCGPLKEKYYNENTNCKDVIVMAAKLLDNTIKNLKKQHII